GGARPQALIDDLPLFRAAPPLASSPTPIANPVALRLQSIQPDELTPIDALRLIYELKDLAKS
ncbi:MAG: hypothetical protein GW948_08640, partial [Rhodobacterales bacterium]|nr:hypothetical protein [Rhodobacterales bacterium]